MTDTRPKVLVTAPEYRKGEACFTAAPGMECLPAPDAEEELAAVIRDSASRYVIVGGRTYSGALYEALQPGGVIARFGVGHDGIDKNRATARRLFCTNTPGVLDRSVAEHAMLLLAAGARHLISATMGMANHTWQPRTGEDLHGKTLAIVGCGGIGRAVARIATLGYGMRVVGYVKPGAAAKVIEHFQLVTNDFSEAVRAANFVSLHIPDVPDNRHFINSERLTCFDSRAWLINTARGNVVDEAALFDALAGGRLGGAALDVFQREPYVPADSNRDLRSLPNVVLTPHVGSNTVEANRRMAERALQNVAFAVAGEFGKMDLLNREILG